MLGAAYFCLIQILAIKKLSRKQQKTRAGIDSKQAYAITDMVKQELGKCITSEDFTAVPECITTFKDQLASETQKCFGRTYEI